MFINFEGIYFNKSFIAGLTITKLKTEAEASGWFEGDPNKTDKLKELHKLCSSSDKDLPDEEGGQGAVIGE